ncbi:MFS transporter [Piscirickettsia salmonis]|uniref:Spectinomycin tetracycline efflux pump n=1 Tax=Piscirickettsia salmonis TaxID=1238 RepID=A0A9Q5VB32_PISSA|nr:MFS transporter [Piscirickettsia salmonis]ALA25823.1 major Facilitator Superfamily protein [Piscirickettsia salmonis]APS43301.1 MFS transporter [Piscirickettsia salmonis]APS46651.1 MFS transporter [Piscirickettsia salmonis]APS50629.1 MFS transporter [Piscirickettsia salmonis]APS53831.1 MFS transporter [Piscirickettsia salmonis]
MRKNNLLFILAILALPILMINIEYTGITVVTPVIATALAMPLAQANWIALAYLLVFSAFIIAGGRLGDLYSAKLIMILGLVLFIGGSLIGGISVSFWQILIGRGMQGLGAAVAFPNITATAYLCAPGHKKGAALAGLTGVVGLAMAIGPPLAGLLTSYGSWRWFFLINIPIGVVTIFIIWNYLPEINSTSEKLKGKFDTLGVIFLAIFLSSITYGLSCLKNGLNDLMVLCLSFMLAAVSLSLFIYNEKRAEHALICLEHFSNKKLIVSCLVRSGIHFGVYIVLFVIGLYLSFVMGFSADIAGLVLFPMSIAIGLFSFVSGKLVDKYEAYVPTSLGIILLIICYIGFIYLPIQEHVSLIMVLFLLYGIAYTLTSPGLMKMTVSAVDEADKGLASGVFYMMSLFGSTVGLGIAGLVLHCYRGESERLSLILAFPWLMVLCLIITIISFVFLYGFKQSLVCD